MEAAGKLLTTTGTMPMELLTSFYGPRRTSANKSSSMRLANFKETMEKGLWIYSLGTLTTLSKSRIRKFSKSVVGSDAAVQGCHTHYHL
jgi:hypothetical protein